MVYEGNAMASLLKARCDALKDVLTRFSWDIGFTAHDASDSGGWTSQTGELDANLGVGITKRPRFIHHVFRATAFQVSFPS
jgi:hypothetical protein